MSSISSGPSSRVTMSWHRTVGIFNDYILARRMADQLAHRGVPRTSMTIVVDGTSVPYDGHLRRKRVFATLVGLLVGAIVGATVGGGAAAVSGPGFDMEWPLAALYGLIIGAVLGAPLGQGLNRAIETERKVPGARPRNAGSFRLVIDPERFDQAVALVPKEERAVRGRVLRPSHRSPSGAS